MTSHYITFLLILLQHHRSVTEFCSKFLGKLLLYNNIYYILKYTTSNYYFTYSELNLSMKLFILPGEPANVESNGQFKSIISRIHARYFTSKLRLQCMQVSFLFFINYSRKKGTALHINSLTLLVPDWWMTIQMEGNADN